MTKKVHCQLCLNGPEGIEGHPLLECSTSGPSQKLRFVCSECGASWAREYAGSGQFAWIDLSGAD